MIYTHILCSPIKGSAEIPDDSEVVVEEPSPCIWRVAAIDSGEITAFYQDGLTGGTMVQLKTGDTIVARNGFVEFNRLYTADRKTPPRGISTRHMRNPYRSKRK